MKYQVGDWVRIKDWDLLRAEYGVDRNGNIDHTFPFSHERMPYCKVPAIIESIERCGLLLKFKDEEKFFVHEDLVEPCGSPDLKSQGERMFALGDKVRVRKWDDLVDEFGTDEDGDIDCKSQYFLSAMSALCGTVARISQIVNYDQYKIEGCDKYVFPGLSLILHGEQQVQTEAVEICQHCDNFNAYADWDFEKDGYIAKCKHCGERIFLCHECLHADDNPYGKCDFYEKEEGRGCFRGFIPHTPCQKNTARHFSYENSYIQGRESFRYDNPDVLGSVTIDAFPSDDTEGHVVAEVFLTVHKDFVVSWHSNEERMKQEVMELIEDSKKELLKLHA